MSALAPLLGADISPFWSYEYALAEPVAEAKRDVKSTRILMHLKTKPPPVLRPTGACLGGGWMA
jgi:hypothetical protein